MRGFHAMAVLKSKAAKRQERIAIRHDQKEALQALTGIAGEMDVAHQKRWKRIVNSVVKVLGAATKPLRRRRPT